MRVWPLRTMYSLLIPVFAAAALVGQAAAAPMSVGPEGWPTAGQDITNSRNAAAEHLLGPGNASRLSTAWSVTTAGNVTSTPTESDGTAYFPDAGGTLWAMAERNGQVRWSHIIAEQNGIARYV